MKFRSLVFQSERAAFVETFRVCKVTLVLATPRNGQRNLCPLGLIESRDVMLSRFPRDCAIVEMSRASSR